MYSRNLSAPAFAADFPPDAPKFNQRTLHVRLINLCTSDKKSSHKIRHSEIPRVHFIVLLFTAAPFTATWCTQNGQTAHFRACCPRVFCDLRSQKTPRGILPVNQCQLVKRTIARCCLSWGGRRRQLLYPTEPRSRSEKSAAVLSSKRPR